MTTDTTTVTDGETPDDTTTPQVETTTTTASGETPETTTEDTQKELERLRAAVKRANADAKKDRLKAEELDKLKADIEASKLSETEKLQKQLAELQKSYETEKQQAQAYKINAEVRVHALQLGFADPDDAIKFLDQSQIIEENGTPSNVEDLLKALAKEKSYLLKGKTATTSGGATNPPRSSSTAQQTLSWEIIGQMKPDEYMARRPEIAKWISEHPHRYGSGM